jgi:hypothetical protein
LSRDRYIVQNATEQGLEVALASCPMNYELHSISWNPHSVCWVVIFQPLKFGESG